MTRTLLVGFNKGMVGNIDSWAPRGSVVVIEDPDIYRKKGHAAIWPNHSCVQKVVLASYHQTDDFLAVAEEEHERNPFDAVLPCMEYAVPSAAAIAAKLDLPGATEAAALTLRDKIRLREVTTRAGMSGPAWREVTGPDDVRRPKPPGGGRSGSTSRRIFRIASCSGATGSSNDCSAGSTASRRWSAVALCCSRTSPRRP